MEAEQEAPAVLPVSGQHHGRRQRLAPPVNRAAPAPADVRGIEEAAPSRDNARRESVYRRLLALADLFGGVTALVLAVNVFGDDRLRLEVLAFVPLVVLVAKVQGLYDRDALLLNKTTLDEAPKLFQAATLYTLLIAVAQTRLVDGQLSPTQLIGLWMIVFIVAVAGRWVAREIACQLVEMERILVIGGPAETARVADKLREHPRVNAMVVGRIALDPRDPEQGTVGTMAQLQEVVDDLGVHRAIVAPGDASSDRTLEGIRAAKAVGVQVSVLPRLLEVVGSSVEFDQLYGVSVLGIRRFGLTTSSQAIKRGMDEIAAFAGLILLSPLFALIAVAIKRTSPGPVFFRQQRVGKDGELFEVLKFRTMVDGAEARRDDLLHRNEAADGFFKISDDPRITGVGRLLRRTSLDELPQLINVWRGEMSLVGPRPLIPEEDRRIEGRHRRRLHLKPGMTGQWQVFGSSKIPLREMVTIDYLYVANWSLWGDIKILCRTVLYMLARRGL